MLHIQNDLFFVGDPGLKFPFISKEQILHVS